MPALITVSRPSHASSDAPETVKNESLPWNAPVATARSTRQEQHRHEHATRNGEDMRGHVGGADGEWGSRVPRRTGEKTMLVSGWERPSLELMGRADRARTVSPGRAEDRRPRYSSLGPGEARADRIPRKNGHVRRVDDHRTYGAATGYGAVPRDAPRDRETRIPENGLGEVWRGDIAVRDHANGNRRWRIQERRDCDARAGFRSVGRYGEGRERGRETNGVLHNAARARSSDRWLDGANESNVRGEVGGLSRCFPVGVWRAWWA